MIKFFKSFFQNNFFRWTFYFRPNDPRDRRLPKEIIREALCLANNRQQFAKRPSYNTKGKRNTVRIQSGNARLETQLENMERRLREASRKDIEAILIQIREIEKS